LEIKACESRLHRGEKPEVSAAKDAKCEGSKGKTTRALFWERPTIPGREY